MASGCIRVHGGKPDDDLADSGSGAHPCANGATCRTACLDLFSRRLQYGSSMDRYLRNDSAKHE